MADLSELWTVGAVCLMLINLFGDCLIFLLYYKFPMLRSSATWLLVSLATSSFLVATVAMPLWILVTTTFYSWKSFSALATWLDVFCSSAVISNITLISLIQLFAIWRPAAHDILFTSARVKQWMTTAWIYAAIFASMMMGCLTGDEVYFKTYIVIHTVALYGIPFFIMLGACWETFKASREDHRVSQTLEMSANVANDSTDHLTRPGPELTDGVPFANAIYTVFVLFVLFWSPWFAVTVVNTMTHGWEAPYRLGEYYIVWLPYIFASIIQYVYLFANQGLRMGMKEAICC